MSFKRKNKSNLILVLPVLVLTIIFSLTYSYGAEILKGVEEVKAFGGYKVNSEVQVSEGKISHIEITEVISQEATQKPIKLIWSVRSKG